MKSAGEQSRRARLIHEKRRTLLIPFLFRIDSLTTYVSIAIDLDGRDPDFAASLRKIGPVDPSTNYEPPQVPNQGSVQTVFPTSSNPALLVIRAREQITKAAQAENAQMGLANFQGRQFLDSLTIHQALTMREKQHLPSREIERLLQLKKGTVDRFGKNGVFSPAT